MGHTPFKAPLRHLRLPHWQIELSNTQIIELRERVRRTIPSKKRHHEVVGSERLTGALLDRLTHHVSILGMNGDSYRLGQSRACKARIEAEAQQ